MARPFRIGTRGSPLALTQANLARSLLAAAHERDASAFEIVPIRTTGDRVQDRPLAEIGGKALWTKELDRALIEGEIDCAVHSMKDVETIRPSAIVIAAILERADVRERLLGASSIEALPLGAAIGTSSPRRAAQMRRMRPDLRIVPLRGNVDTRIAKLTTGEADATLLAAAGLERLGRGEVGVALPIETMLPAPSQGAIGIEVRASDADARALVGAIDHADTHACVMAERALLAALEADCHSPVAAHARFEGGVMVLAAQLLSEDGAEHVTGSLSGHDGITLARALARDLIERAPAAVCARFGSCDAA
ncbi:hydroxymethylbilane synthase [Sphingomonas spermidinifaciens]|uniref:Porphobilinogen deaminase n=1 Tax=Sphingomonas spermidinifaciens TaxID=1141889 RepID=A0A2A4B2K7_9SPHN|nr:hydroxymethylbilane synthase [Sphingomonas spermidinifaciens]PCD01856.1 hydroxymethylbilane synthase [Sphingomonas spermidinifaciens]